MICLTELDNEPLWTDRGVKSGISVRELISIQKQPQQKVQAGNEWSNILTKFSKVREKNHHHHHVLLVIRNNRSEF